MRLYFNIQRTWRLEVKTRHQIFLEVEEGFWSDTLSLYVDDKLVVYEKASIWRRKNFALFDIDGRTHELRWIWGFFEGFPLSIVLMYKGQNLAQYGTDRAARDSWFEE